MSGHRCPHCDRPSERDGWCDICTAALTSHPAPNPSRTSAPIGAQSDIMDRAVATTLAASVLLEAARPIAGLLPCTMASRAQLEALATAVARMDAAFESEVAP